MRSFHSSPLACSREVHHQHGPPPAVQLEQPLQSLLDGAYLLPLLVEEVGDREPLVLVELLWIGLLELVGEAGTGLQRPVPLLLIAVVPENPPRLVERLPLGQGAELDLRLAQLLTQHATSDIPVVTLRHGQPLEEPRLIHDLLEQLPTVEDELADGEHVRLLALPFDQLLQWEVEAFGRGVAAEVLGELALRVDDEHTHLLVAGVRHQQHLGQHRLARTGLAEDAEVVHSATGSLKGRRQETTVIRRLASTHSSSGWSSCCQSRVTTASKPSSAARR